MPPLYFEEAQKYAYAYLIQITSSYATLRLVTPPENAGQLMAGTPVQVVLEEQPTVMHKAHLHHCAENLLTLQWSVPMPMQEKRAHVRYACDMEIAYRHIHSSGATGAWLDAQCVDISLGGLGLQMPQRTSLSEVIQLWLPIDAPSDVAGRVYTDDGVVVQSAQKALSLRLSARVLFPYGVNQEVIRCGVMFQNVNYKQLEQLNEFIEELRRSKKN